MPRNWERQLWKELYKQAPADRVVVAAEWITFITQELLTQLANFRRYQVIGILADPEWDATRLAETIGARRGTIMRLAEEGRAAQRSDSATPPLPRVG